MKQLSIHLVGLLALGALVPGCATTTIPLVPIPVPIPRISFLGGDDLDYSRKDWAEACGKLVERMREEYPYTELKGIAWDALGAELQARAGRAEESRDREAFYAALRWFAESLRDGHIGLTVDNDLLGEQFGGGYGIEVAQLDDGRVMVSKVIGGGPAAAVGVQPFVEVVAWNGLPIAEAAAKAPMLWAGHPPATDAARAEARLQGLVRGRVGAQAKVVFRSGASPNWEVALVATEQDWAALDTEGLLSALEVDTGSVLEHRLVNGDVGVIKVHQLAPTLTAPFPGRAFRNALQEFQQQEARGLVLDLRGGSTGLDEFGAEFASYFAGGDAVYRELAVYNRKSGTFEADAGTRVNYTPQETRFEGAVVVLVDADTSHSAEMLAWSLQQQAHARVAGTVTSGVTPVPERTVSLPGGYSFTYPTARWLAADGQTPVEAKADGKGGVMPDLPVARDEATLRGAESGGDPVLDLAVGALSAP